VRAGCLVIALPLLIVLSPVIALVLAWKELSRRALEREFTRRHGPGVRRAERHRLFAQRG